MEDLTQKFQEIDAKSPTLFLKVSGKVHNLCGQYATRLQEIKSVIYSQADTASTEKEQLAKEAKLLRTKVVEVHTFPKNGNDKITAPLGGNRGYIKGALITALRAKYSGGQTSKKTSPVYGYLNKLTNGLFIEPNWIELGDNYSNPDGQPAKFFITKIGIEEFYDTVKEEPIEFTLRADCDIKEDIMLGLLSFIQRLGIGPKRRGLLKIEKVEKL